MIKMIQHTADEIMTDENLLTPPKGWMIPDEALPSLNTYKQEARHRSTVAFNLPVAAHRAEQLIDVLKDRLSINVPVSYLRIDEGISFHVLLLVERRDYLSPRIHAARILAEEFTCKDDEFDIHFVFSVRSENMLVDPITAQGYTLMYIGEDEHAADEQQQNAA